MYILYVLVIIPKPRIFVISFRVCAALQQSFGKQRRRRRPVHGPVPGLLLGLAYTTSHRDATERATLKCWPADAQQASSASASAGLLQLLPRHTYDSCRCCSTPKSCSAPSRERKIAPSPVNLEIRFIRALAYAQQYIQRERAAEAADAEPSNISAIGSAA